MTATSAIVQTRTSFWHHIVAEWHGDGELMKQGAWSEIAVTLFATLPISGVLSAWPSASVHSHTFNLFMWYYPAWTVACFMSVSAVLSATGIALFFARGRCVASRLCRLAGSGLGLGVWFFLLMIDGLAFGWKDSTVYLYLLPTMLYTRSFSLSWRRWFR